MVGRGGAKGYGSPSRSDVAPIVQNGIQEHDESPTRTGRHLQTPESSGVYKPSGPRQESKSGSQSSFVTFSDVVSVNQNDGKIKEEEIKGDENTERGNWSGRFDFILSMLGYAVGLGNIWRFPYYCYKNGGGAFLLPFVIIMIFIGIPIFFLESSLGQFSSCGPMVVWKFAPLFKGVGIAMVVISCGTSIYYNMVLAWAQYYFFTSMRSEVPWKRCTNDWNTKDCSLKLQVLDCTGRQSEDGQCYVDDKIVGLWNLTLFKESTGRERISPAEEYWKYVIGQSESIEEFGAPKWDLVLNLLLAWVICFLCLIKGVKSSGKVVYFTAIFPYIVLIILFIYGLTFEGAAAGINRYLTPEWSRLADAQVWNDAAIQVFFSMSLAGGGLMTLSSYNRFHNNILRDTLIVTIGDTITSIFAGFVVFSFLGEMARKLHVEVGKVATEGPGLVFVVYPDIMASMSETPEWAILFFIMVITLGLDSQFAMLETVLTAALDQFPHVRKWRIPMNAGICFVLFLLGLPLTCPGGIYLFQIVDKYIGGWTLLIVGLCEIIAVAYVYGIKRFWKDLRVMIGFDENSMVWRIWYIYCFASWCIISPVVLFAMFIFSWVQYSPTKDRDYVFPLWADIFGWFMAFGAVISIPVVMIYKWVKEDDGDSCFGKLKLLLAPNRYWGPSLVKHRRLVDYVDGFVVDPELENMSRYQINFGYSTSSIGGCSDLRTVTSEMTISLPSTTGMTSSGYSFGAGTVESIETTV